MRRAAPNFVSRFVNGARRLKECYTRKNLVGLMINSRQVEVLSGDARVEPIMPYEMHVVSKVATAATVCVCVQRSGGG